MSVTFSEVELQDGLRKIVIEGTLDAPGAMAIEDDFQALLRERNGHVIADLSKVDYVSSYGLRMLLVGAKTLHEAGGGLYLAAPNKYVLEVIRMVGYDTIFPVYASVEEALRALSK